MYMGVGDSRETREELEGDLSIARRDYRRK